MGEPGTEDQAVTTPDLEGYRAALDLAGVGEAQADPETGCLLYVNRMMCEISGYDECELLGVPLSEFIHEVDREEHIERFERMVRGEGVCSGETRFVSKDGRYVWVEVNATVIRDGDGKPLRTVAVVRDVTSRHHASEKLKLQTELLEQTHDAVIVWELDGPIVYWNRGAEVLYGYPAEEAVGKVGHELLRTEFPDGIETFTETLRREGRWEGELVHVARDGRRVTVESRHVAAGTESGHDRVLETNEDVTERRRALEMLGDSHGLLRSIVEGTADAVYVKDLEGRYLLVSSFAAQIIGGPGAVAEDIVGKDDTAFFPPEVARALMEVDRQVRETGETDVLEEEVPADDGSTRTFLSTKLPYRDHTGRVAGIMGFSTETTERRRAEEALREVREAERVRIARDLHDGVLQDLTYAAAEAEISQIISGEADVQERLVKSVGAMRRAAAGLRNALYDLRPTGDRLLPRSLHTTVELARRMAPDQEVDLIVGEGVPEAPLGEEGHQLLRVIQEALANARRHSGARRVSVSLRVEGSDLLAEVSDDGRGFPPEYRPGMGTRGMRERAADLEGELEIDNAPGAGVRVRLRIPLARLVQDPVTERAREEQHGLE